MRVKPEFINVSYPPESSVYRAHGSVDGLRPLPKVDLEEGAVPSFNTRTGQELTVPVSLIVPEPVEHPTYTLQ